MSQFIKVSELEPAVAITYATPNGAEEQIVLRVGWIRDGASEVTIPAGATVRSVDYGWVRRPEIRFAVREGERKPSLRHENWMKP